MDIAQRIYAKALSEGMPQFVSVCIVVQAAHETAGFTSNVFLSCNNLNGYKWVNQSTAAGPCLKSPEGDYYAKYNTIEDSVHEICAWIRRRQKEGKFPADLNSITTLEQYAQLLKNSGWYGDSVANYTSGLYYWSDKLVGLLKNPVVDVSFVLIIIILGIVAYKKKLFK